MTPDFGQLEMEGAAALTVPTPRIGLGGDPGGWRYNNDYSRPRFGGVREGVGGGEPEAGRR